MEYVCPMKALSEGDRSKKKEMQADRQAGRKGKEESKNPLSK